MSDLEKCRAEIIEALKKYNCSLKVSALLETDGTKFKVDVIENITKPEK